MYKRFIWIETWDKNWIEMKQIEGEKWNTDLKN